jgi:hypothetical protein
MRWLHGNGKSFFILIFLSNVQVLSTLYGVLISGETVGQDAAGGGPFLLDFQVQNKNPLSEKCTRCVCENKPDGGNI